MLTAIEPNEIAISGYGCRLPGSADPAAFWKAASYTHLTLPTKRIVYIFPIALSLL